MIDDPEAVEIEIKSERFRSGTSTGRRLIPGVDGPEQSIQAVELAKAAADKLRTGKWIKHEYDNEGDVLTLADLMERNGIEIGDLERELKLREFDVDEQLSVGDVVEITRISNGEPKEPEHGVVFEVVPADENSGGVAKIYWSRSKYSYLEGVTPSNSYRKYPFEELRLGRGNMMGELYDIHIVAQNEINDDELTSLQKKAIESAEIDEKAKTLSVTEESQWTSSAEGNNVDYHAKLTVSGPLLDEAVQVKCRNIFDGGWVANVTNADLEDETEKAVIRAARNESPIPTNIRL